MLLYENKMIFLYIFFDYILCLANPSVSHLNIIQWGKCGYKPVSTNVIIII